MFVLRAYSKIAFLPFTLCSNLMSTFLFSEEFNEGSAAYYVKFGFLRGLLSLVLLALWLAAVLSPGAVITFIDLYVFKNTLTWSDKESLIMSIIGTIAFSIVLAVINIMNKKTQTITLGMFKLNLYLLSDIAAVIIAGLTVLMYWNARKVFEGDFDGPERRYLKYVSYLFLLSALEWTVCFFRFLIWAYPVKKFDHFVLMEKHKEDQFKQQMVTMQEGLFTLMELCFLPFHLSIFWCLKFSSKIKFMPFMVEMSNEKISRRLKLYGKSVLIVVFGLLAAISSGPFQNLTLRMIREMNVDPAPEDGPEKILNKELVPVQRRLISSFAKYYFLLIACPSRINLIADEYFNKEEDFVELEQNWFMYSFKNIFLELNPHISAAEIVVKYNDMMLTDFAATFLLILSAVLNPITFIQLVLGQLAFKRVLTREHLDQKNHMIFQMYPLIFIDLPVMALALIGVIIGLPFLHRNISVYKRYLLKSKQPHVLNLTSNLAEPHDLFFVNLLQSTTLIWAILLAEWLYWTSYPLLIFLPEHRAMLGRLRNEKWFDVPLRIKLTWPGAFRFFGELYYKARRGLLKDHKYVEYFAQMDEDLEKKYKNPELTDELEKYIHKANSNYRFDYKTHSRKIFVTRFTFYFARLKRKIAGTLFLGGYFEGSDQYLEHHHLVQGGDKHHYEQHLEKENVYASKVNADWRHACLILAFKLLSLTLMWRLPLFTRLMATGPFTNPDPEYQSKKNTGLAMNLYKFCLGLVFRDLTGQAFFSLILLLSPIDNKCVNHKWKVLIEETPLLTEEKIAEQFKEYYKFKKQYVVYVVDDLLLYVNIGLAYIFSYRKEIFDKIRLLTTLPQLENIDARKVNTLMISILFKDWIVLGTSIFIMLFSWPRLYSFLLYVKEGYFHDDINIEVRYNKFESASLISNTLDERRKLFFFKVLKGFKTDAAIFGAMILSLINPTRVYFWMYVYRKLKVKYNMKKTKQGRNFYDEEYANEMMVEVKNVARESKEDLLSFIAISIILFGIYEVGATWERIKKLMLYQWRHSELYRWLNKPKKEAVATRKENDVFLNNLNWMCMIRVGDFLSMDDRLKLCLLNKKSRHYFMSTPFIWVIHYRRKVNPTVASIEDTSILPIECINHYRRELAELNSKELDFKLGMRFVLKEEAIRSVIGLPRLISSPYDGLCKLREYLSKKNINITNVGEILRQHSEDAQTEHNVWVEGGDGLENRAIVYRVRLRHPLQALTTEAVPDEFKSRMRGFEVLEATFYRLVFFLLDKAMRIYGLFVYNYEYDEPGVFAFLRNFGKSLLQPLLIIVGLFCAWWLIQFYYRIIGMDFIHCLVGPLGLHFLIGIVVANCAMHPYYGNRRFNPLGFLLILKNSSVRLGVRIGKPLYEILTKVFKFVLYRMIQQFSDFIKTIFNQLKSLVFAIYWAYTLPIILPTKLLVGRGTLLEIIHLIVVLAWICSPGYFGFKLGGFRNIFLSVMVCLVHLGVSIRVISQHSQHRR